MEPQNKVNILLVDDQPGNLLALEAILDGLGQNLISARSGAEALRHLLREDFALILLDVKMPDMDGLETAALVRSRDRSRHIPIIFLTGYEHTDVQTFKGYSLGAVDFLTKPLVPEVLRSKVSVFVELAQKTEKIQRQAEQLRAQQQREHEQRLIEERQRWEMERLREEAAEEKRLNEELARTMAERVRAEERVREKARQQALVADLGRRALVGIDVGPLLDEAVQLVAGTLNVEYCVVLELQGDGHTLLMRAGVGWKEGCLGKTTLDAHVNGYLSNGFLTEEPVIVEDLPAEERYRQMSFMREHGVISGMSVLIRGNNGHPFGILGAHTSRKRSFTQEDVHFLQAVAHVLSAAIQRWRQETQLARLKDELAAQLADMTQLQQLSARLSTNLELEAVVEEVLSGVMLLQRADAGVLLLYDRDHNNLYPAASVGLSAECLRTIQRVPLGGGLYGISAARRSMVAVDSARDEELAPGLTVGLAGHHAVCCTPLVSRTGDIIGTLATHFSRPHRPSERDQRLVDLYARQAAEAIENARLHREIREANQGKDEFLAMLAHELRNPLAPILNALHVQRLTQDPEQLEQARAMMERQTRHMARLVDDLLEVSRITRGKIALRKEPVRLAEVVQRVVESSRTLIEARGHQLDTLIADESIRLLADATRLEQVLDNLLNNAAKYTEPGGHIWLTVRREGQQAVLSVRDNGIGISREMLLRIFELFMQAHSTLDRALGGLGIGLTLVRRLVEMHEGTVEALSEGPGKGSEFVVRLPLLNAPLADAAAAPSASVTEKRSYRVLVVDDNRDAAESLAMMLRLEGHEVEMSHTGLEALEAARKHQPEVVLLDIGLPGMSGHEVAVRLQDELATGRPLLVALTGYGQEEDRRRSREVGFDHHLVKPVDLQTLRELLARA